MAVSCVYGSLLDDVPYPAVGRVGCRAGLVWGAAAGGGGWTACGLGCSEGSSGQCASQPEQYSQGAVCGIGLTNLAGIVVRRADTQKQEPKSPGASRGHSG